VNFLHLPVAILDHLQFGQKNKGESFEVAILFSSDGGTWHPRQGHGGSMLATHSLHTLTLHSEHCRIRAGHRRRWSPAGRMAGQKNEVHPFQLGCRGAIAGFRATFFCADLGSGVAGMVEAEGAGEEDRDAESVQEPLLGGRAGTSSSGFGVEERTMGAASRDKTELDGPGF
jgi:hypothetical protein